MLCAAIMVGALRVRRNSLGERSFLLELTYIDKGGIEENGEVASLESVSNDLISFSSLCHQPLYELR